MWHRSRTASTYRVCSSEAFLRVSGSSDRSSVSTGRGCWVAARGLRAGRKRFPGYKCGAGRNQSDGWPLEGGRPCKASTWRSRRAGGQDYGAATSGAGRFPRCGRIVTWSPARHSRRSTRTRKIPATRVMKHRRNVPLARVVSASCSTAELPALRQGGSRTHDPELKRL